MSKIKFNSYEYFEGYIRYNNEIEVEDSKYEMVMNKLKDLEKGGSEGTHDFIYRELYKKHNIDIKQLGMTIDEIHETDSECTTISFVRDSEED